jgi:hypothetical protein
VLAESLDTNRKDQEQENLQTLEEVAQATYQQPITDSQSSLQQPLETTTDSFKFSNK